MKTAHSAWLQVGIFAAAVLLGIFFRISKVEWLAVVFASGLVFVSEAFNSAIEVDIDLTSPEYHPQARDTKDIAAGAVLISAATAAIVGLIVFGPHVAESLSLIP